MRRGGYGIVYPKTVTSVDEWLDAIGMVSLPSPSSIDSGFAASEDKYSLVHYSYAIPLIRLHRPGTRQPSQRR